jgi:hypothetical protein
LPKKTTQVTKKKEVKFIDSKVSKMTTKTKSTNSSSATKPNDKQASKDGLNKKKSHSVESKTKSEKEKEKQADSSNTKKVKKSSSQTDKNLEKSKVSKIDSDSSTSKEANVKEISSDLMRDLLKKNFLEKLKTRMEKSKNTVQLSQPELEELVKKIETEFSTFFKSNQKDYQKQYKKIVFNLQDEKNDSFFIKILTGEIAPKDLPQMSNEGMASDQKIAERQREREKDLTLRLNYSNELARNKLSLALDDNVEKGRPNINDDELKEIKAKKTLAIKKDDAALKNPLDEVYNNLSLGLLKYPKSSVKSPLSSSNIESSKVKLVAEPDVSAKVVIQEFDEQVNNNFANEATNQDIISTPDKNNNDGSNSSLGLQNYTNFSLGSPKLLRDSLSEMEDREKEVMIVSEVSPKPSVSTIAKDTTHDHGNHNFCINCKLCTAQVNKTEVSR